VGKTTVVKNNSLSHFSYNTLSSLLMSSKIVAILAEGEKGIKRGEKVC
jgi:hypothetical protein